MDYNLPVQLELELIAPNGKVSTKNKPCGMTDLSSLTPGLDATLCKCSQCIKRAKDGIWWVDTYMRESIRLAKRGHLGDLPEDKSQSNKAKAKSKKR